MVEKEDNEKEKVLEMNIDELELSVRSYNCLKRAGINTVEELCNRTPEDMMKVRNLGRKRPQIPGRGSCKTERIRPAAQPERRGLRYRVGGRALQCVPFMQIRGRVSPNGTGPCITSNNYILYSRHSVSPKGMSAGFRKWRRKNHGRI